MCSRLAEIPAGASLRYASDQVVVNASRVSRVADDFVRRGLARGRGGVVNVASQMAFQPMPYFAAYAASQAFVLSFSEALAEELRDTGVRVTAVAPGFVTTEFAEVAGSHDPERRFPHLQPGRVVASALRAYERGRTVKVVGALYAFLVFAGRFAPRSALRRMMGRALRPTPSPVPPT
jgi:short-subunit dehydrogenase